MEMIFFCFVVIYLLGVYSFCMKKDFFMLMLLSLEFMNLIIFFMFYLCLWCSFEKYVLMYYLTFCVCEGSFGLSLLVSMIRFYGSDYLYNLNVLKC